MVPHWAFWSSFYWGASSGQETIVGVGSFMVHDMVGQHTGIQQGQMGSPGVDTWTPHLWNFESAYSEKQLPPPGTGLGLQPGSAISASWFGRYEPSPGVIWGWDPTWQRQLCELVTPWLLLWVLQLSTLLLMILSIWLYPVSMGRHIGGWLLWESSLSGISLGCGSPYPLIWAKITNGRCDL